MKINFRRILPALVVLLVLLFVFQPFSGDPQNSSGEPAPTAVLSASPDIQADEKTDSNSPESLSAGSSGSETAGQTEKPSEELQPAEGNSGDEEELLDEHGSYTTKEDVSLYLLQYGHLPENFITKNEARKLGWEGGSLKEFAPGKCIGGDRFGNREGLLPAAKGRTWTECDIGTLGKSSRGAKRLLFSNDGLIYYTDDHYESFTLLYGEP